MNNKCWLILLLIINAAHAFIATGTTTLDSSKGLNNIGFLFNTGNATGNDGDFYYYNNALWTNNGQGIKDLGLININLVQSCDLTGYTKSNIPAIIGHTYCIKTIEGSYAKVWITSLTSTTLSFDWAHQRDGTSAFTQEENENTPVEMNINYALIGIIIVLAIIIIVLWKYR